MNKEITYEHMKEILTSAFENMPQHIKDKIQKKLGDKNDFIRD